MTFKKFSRNRFLEASNMGTRNYSPFRHIMLESCLKNTRFATSFVTYKIELFGLLI